MAMLRRAVARASGVITIMLLAVSLLLLLSGPAMAWEHDFEHEGKRCVTTTTEEVTTTGEVLPSSTDVVTSSSEATSTVTAAPTSSSSIPTEVLPTEVTAPSTTVEVLDTEVTATPVEVLPFTGGSMGGWLFLAVALVAVGSILRTGAGRQDT